jgi:putative transposase
MPNRPAHLRTFDYTGPHRYFLTFCTFHRQRVFTTAGHVDLVRTQIRRAAAEEQVAVVAYCFMPDHLHLLIEGQRDDSDALRFIKNAKQYSGFYFRQACATRLWQRYGFERVLRADEDVLSVARYIFENPVRGGLVRSAQDHPFTGSDVYTTEAVLEAVQMRDGWKRSA